MCGKLLSFPSSWYNKKNGWMKRNFGDALVYFVAVVRQSDNPEYTPKPMHTIQILGDNESAVMDTAMLCASLSMYEKHGTPRVPLYRLTPTAFDFDLTNSPKKKPKKKKTQETKLLRDVRAAAALYDWTSAAVPHNIEYLLSEAATRSTLHCQGWAWSQNSCHLDAWLMMELAAYADLIQKRKNNPQSVLDVPLVQHGDENTPALLRLLLQVATEDAESHKRSFWAAQVLKRNNLREWTSFAAIEDHDRDLLPYGDRTIELFSVATCTSGSHESRGSSSHSSVLVSHGWYPMPDEVKHDPLTLVASVDPCVMVRHKTVQEAFTTVLARSDTATNMCGKCAANGEEKMHFKQTTKDPAKTKYPFFLGFFSNQTYGKDELPMAAHLSFLLANNVSYDLVAISF
jgi:hypothetical protein